MVGLDEIGSVAKSIAARDQVRLRIAATPPLINSQPVMEALKQFSAHYPKAMLSLEPRHRLEIEDWVASRRINLALALLPTDHPTLRPIPLVETCAVAAMSPNHPLCAKDVIAPEMLSDVAVILPSRQPLRIRIDAELEKTDQQVEPRFEATSAITVARMAASEIGVAICDPFSPTAFEGNLVLRPWEPRVKLVYGAIVDKTQDMSAPAQQLLAILEDAFKPYHM